MVEETGCLVVAGAGLRVPGEASWGQGDLSDGVPPCPQMWACALGHREAAERLCRWDRRALAVPDTLGRLPLGLARARGHLALVTRLEELQPQLSPASPRCHLPGLRVPSPLSASPDTGMVPSPRPLPAPGHRHPGVVTVTMSPPHSLSPSSRCGHRHHVPSPLLATVTLVWLPSPHPLCVLGHPDTHTATATVSPCPPKLSLVPSSLSPGVPPCPLSPPTLFVSTPPPTCPLSPLQPPHVPWVCPHPPPRTKAAPLSPPRAEHGQQPLLPLGALRGTGLCPLASRPPRPPRG